MPQMMPINWLMLYLIFTLIFLLFLILIYYNFLKYPNKIFLMNNNNNNNEKNKAFNWKW